jgi:hypothetical protein
MEAMGGGNENRRHRRLPVRMGIFCRKVGSLHDHVFRGSTVDISPDGLLAECSQNTVMDTGDLFNIELDIPDAGSADRFEGKVSAYARVVRIVALQPGQKAGKKSIAFQFCTRPQFDI